MAIPLSVSLLHSLGNNSFLEFRFSYTPLFITEEYKIKALGDTSGTWEYVERKKQELILCMGLGYRYQPDSKGMFFNALLQFWDEPEYEFNRVSFISIGLGYAFGER